MMSVKYGIAFITGTSDVKSTRVLGHWCNQIITNTITHYYGLWPTLDSDNI